MEPAPSRDQSPPAHVPWAEVGLFFAVATLVSAPFRLGLIDLEKTLPLPAGLGVFYHVLRGIGPAVGYFTVRRLAGSRVPRTNTFFGRSRRDSLIAVAVVPVGLAAIGLRDATGLPPAYLGGLDGLMLVCYALGEEYGWRGYLQQALAPIAIWKRLLLIATLWYVWHLNFLRPGMSVGGHVLFFAGLLFGSWGLLRVSEVSGSMLFVAAVHLAFNIVFDVEAPMPRKLLVLAVAIAIWTVLLRRGRNAAPATP